MDRIIRRFDEMAAQNTSFDDQVTFVSMMHTEFYLAGAGDGANLQDRRESIREDMLRGRCSTYVHRATNETFSMWHLNPLLFPLRPIEETTRLYALTLEPPYLKHYNWMVGSAEKAREMHYAGDWLLPPTVATVPTGERMRSFAGQLKTWKP